MNKEINAYSHPFFYQEQLKRIIKQVMAVFATFKVKVGATGETNPNPRLIQVPVVNESKDRVVAWIKSEQTQVKLTRLPIFCLGLTNLELAPELRKGVGVERRTAFTPIGQAPGQSEVVHQFMPVPYKANFELVVVASNQDQHYQLLEQIFVVFDPYIQIQTSDDVMDWTRVHQLELTNINFEENVPAGTDRRLIQTTLTFQAQVYMSIPVEVRNNIVETIKLRVAAVDQIAGLTEQDLLAEIAAVAGPYETVVDVSTLNIDK